MAQASSLLFVLGVIATAIGFAAHVGHAVLLANGRRVVALAPASRPAFATGGVTGSFVTSRRGRVAPPRRSSPRPPPRCRARRPRHAGRLRGCSLASMVLRGIVVGRGPYGNLYEFSVAFGASILGGYLWLATPLPDPPDRVHPGGRGARDAALRVVAAVRDRAARPGPPERAAAHDPRRHGGHLLRDLRDVVRGGRSGTSPRGPATGSRGCRRTRRSTRSRTAR